MAFLRFHVGNSEFSAIVFPEVFEKVGEELKANAAQKKDCTVNGKVIVESDEGFSFILQFLS